MEVAYAKRSNQFFDYNLYKHEKKSWSIIHQKCRAHQENLINNYIVDMKKVIVMFR